jgi:adenosine deaminase
MSPEQPQQGRPRAPFDWRQWDRLLVATTPPGMARLARIYEPDALLDLDGLTDVDTEVFVARVADVLEEGAADGAALIEVRFGFGASQALFRPDFMQLFREAERRVRERYPKLVAEAIGWLNPVNDPGRLLEEERRLEECLRAAREGLAGVDFRVDPYDTEADPGLWEVAYGWAARAADAGLGVTVHVGEFSPANLGAALRVPGLKRIGHGVYAVWEPRLLEQLVNSGVTIECCLTCNVILGAVASYAEHPIRRFVEAGVPVTLNTDLPVHLGTTIGREYAIAAALGFSPVELLEFTRNAVAASFTSGERRAALVEELAQWEARLPQSGKR